MEYRGACLCPCAHEVASYSERDRGGEREGERERERERERKSIE